MAEEITLGVREIVKGIESGKVKKVIVAKNCPAEQVKKLGNVKVEIFEGDQVQLATKLGKPFPIAMIGFNDIHAVFK